MNTKNKAMEKTIIGFIAIIITTTALVGCLGNDGKQTLIQTGSSTVLPLAIAWAEEFDIANIQVSGGGSSHGINALLKGEADLGDASRLMKGSDYESVDCDPNLVNDDGTAQAACSGVLPIKWVIAYDVLTVVVNTENDWATQLNCTQFLPMMTQQSIGTMSHGLIMRLTRK